MTKIIFYLSALILIFITKINAQDQPQKGQQEKQSFESQVKTIATNIENITKEEKSALKIEVESVNVALENNTITKEEAEAKKQILAETRAKNIEDRVAVEQATLEKLIQQKVDGKIKVSDSTHYTFHFPAMKIKNKNDVSEKRTTSQFVLAYGLNNVVTNKSVASSDFYYWQSRFFEWGFTENTRIFKNHNLLHLKYGFSVMYNSVRPTDNRYFVAAPNSQTNLEVFANNLEESHFKNVYLVAPLHVEFDFSSNKSKNDTAGFSTHKGVRLGIGGYGGYRIKSKQKLQYNLDNNQISIKNSGDFNTNNFIYGLSTYVGYKETSLYFKYDLNPLFEKNPIKQNNISLGVRFDFN